MYILFCSAGKGAFKEYWIYIVMLCVQGETLFPNFWTWEALYFCQFFALEFFFRGFMVHGLKHRFGIYSVLVMMIPYCMIHFGKPLPETLAAILAGLVLGILSLKTHSILLGVAIHYSVGLMMDLAALWHKLPQP